MQDQEQQEENNKSLEVEAQENVLGFTKEDAPAIKEAMEEYTEGLRANYSRYPNSRLFDEWQAAEELCKRTFGESENKEE